MRPGVSIERAEAELTSLINGLREARSELERSERNAALVGSGEGTAINVRSPVEGVVVSVKAAPGATVQAGGETLVEIGNPGGLWVVADVPEGEILGRLYVDAHPDGDQVASERVTVTGVVERIDIVPLRGDCPKPACDRVPGAILGKADGFQIVKGPDSRTRQW